MKHPYLLYGVTDRGCLKERTLLEAVREALEGGATIIQLREKQLSYKLFLKEAREIKELTDAYQVPLIINDNVELAKEVDAAGVHIGQEDASLTEARKMLGEDKIIGVSAHNLEEAKKAESCGANYLGVGAVFPTSTKKDATPLTKEMLQAICEGVSIPVVAIGGITKENMDTLKGTGIKGVALVSAIFGQEEILPATKELRKKVEAIVG